MPTHQPVVSLSEQRISEIQYETEKFILLILKKYKEKINQLGQTLKQTQIERLREKAQSDKLKEQNADHVKKIQQLTELESTRSIEIKKIERENERTKKLILQIQNEQQSRTKEEMKRLTGDVFELNNLPIWEFKQAGKNHGPFSFEKILDLKREGKINTNTLMRNLESSTSWMALSEYFEFNAPFEVILSENEGEIQKRFYMKRGSIRVPFYDTATISINDTEIKGICTSISAGGCFVEFTRLKEETFQKDDQAYLTINHETLGQAVICPIIIKNISLHKPRGIGVMFESLDNESRIIIEKYINLALNKSRSLKIA